MTFEQFMARLEVVYGPPKTNDLAAFVEIYREMIGNFTADVYSRGFKLVAAGIEEVIANLFSRMFI